VGPSWAQNGEERKSKYGGLEVLEDAKKQLFKPGPRCRRSHKYNDSRDWGPETVDHGLLRTEKVENGVKHRARKETKIRKKM